MITASQPDQELVVGEFDARSPSATEAGTFPRSHPCPPSPTNQVEDHIPVAMGEFPAEQPSTDDPQHNTQNNSKEQNHEGNENDGKSSSVLTKSRRFKGYLTIFLASIVNFNAALLSDEPLVQSATPASADQQAYAKGVSLLSAIITGLLVLVHLDRYSPLQSVWKKAFQPRSRFESFLLAFLVLWWSVATVIQTSVRGIAGDGKEQYNLYYSTWVCCWTSLWCVERKLVDHGYSAFREFVQGWPSRSPGWIAIFVCCFFTLWWYVDLFNNTKRFPERIPNSIAIFYAPISRAQYQWLIFVAVITLVPSLVFIVAEILRASSGESGKTTNKGTVETVLEGFCLFSLTIGWVPSVIVVTTPGGFASQVGNAYFSTWITTVFVLETFLWYIHDWRGSVHKALLTKEQEYRDHQRQVLKDTHEARGEHLEDDDYDDNDEYQYDTDDDHPVDDQGSLSYDPDQSEVEEAPEASDRRRKESSGSEAYGAVEGHDDASIARERELQHANRQAYFDTLGDIIG